MADERYSDWDAAVDSCEPIVFKFMEVEWRIRTPFDFRAVAASRKAIDAATDDEMVATAIIDFLATHCQDEQQFRLTADRHKPISVSTLLNGLNWVTGKEIGIPIEIKEGGDPLGRSTVSLPPSAPSGRPSAGGSRKRASRTR